MTLEKILMMKNDTENFPPHLHRHIMRILITECDVSVSKLLGFETFPFFWWFRIRYRKNLVSKKLSDSVSEKFGIEKSIGFGFGKNWYRKKYQIRYRTRSQLPLYLQRHKSHPYWITTTLISTETNPITTGSQLPS